jgi:putative ABC transport system permease protein
MLHHRDERRARRRIRRAEHPAEERSDAEKRKSVRRHSRHVEALGAGVGHEVHRFDVGAAVTVATFAGVALVLAMVGVFSVLAYAVEQRRREFAVRVALGASTARLLRLVFGSATRVVAGGALVGLALSAAVSRSITGFLFGVTPLDPVTLGAVTAVVVLTGAVSTVAPALRAARVDPAVAFRSDR